jgi:4-amino-4-deoxy-L-arabinose transferase-like glycosyltransferase
LAQLCLCDIILAETTHPECPAIMRDTRAPLAPTAHPLARYWGWCLAGILLLALALRLWAINFGLPYVEHPDEPFWVFAVLKMIKSGDPNPHDFIYPSLYYYLNAFAYLLYYEAGRLLGAFHTVADLSEPILLIGGSGKTALPGLFLIGRVPSVAMGVATAALVFDVGRRLSGSLVGGLLAALWTAISPALVAHSRFMVPDGPLAFLTTLVLWGAWRIYERGRTRDYLLAGLFLGLAGGMKYNALPFALAPVLAHFLRPGNRGLKNVRLYGLVAVTVAAFLLTTPYAVLDSQAFVKGAFMDVRHYTGGHAGNTGSSLAWYLQYFWGTEGPVLALAATGAIWGIARRSRGAILVTATALAYVLFISAFSVHMVRMALPLVPLLALLAGYCSVELLSPLAGDKERPRAYIGAASVLIAITLVFPLVGAVQDTVRLTRPNSLDTAREWIDANLPAGARIALESYSPWVDPRKFVVQGLYKLNDHPPEWYRDEGYQYLVFSELMFRRFYKDPVQLHDEIEGYEALFQAFEPLKVFTDGGYEVRIYRVP